MNRLKLIYLPWEGLSALLRVLSMSGAAGNAAAFFLYVLVSLLPIAGLLFVLRREKRKFCGADVWLLVLSGYTFYLLYAFINPALLARRVPELLGSAGGWEDVLPLMKAVSSGLWLSILAAWALLSLNRKLRQEEVLDRKDFLYRGVRVMLWAVMALEIFTVLYGGFGELVSGLQRLQENAGATGWDYAALILHAETSLIPEGFLLIILVRFLGLMKALREASPGKEELLAARRLANASTATVAAAVFCTLLWNGALFFCSERLMHLDYRWEISLFPLLTSFGVLLLTRYLRAAKELKQENELIV